MQSRWVKKGKVVGPFGWLALTFIILFLLVVSAFISFNYWYQTALEAPGTGVEKVFVVKKGETSKDIGARLEKEGIIKNSLAFRIFLYLTSTEAQIEAGSFNLSSDKTTTEILEDLQHGQLDRWVTLVEGLRVEEIAEVLTSEFKIDKKKFISLAQEGYMFPDTYLIPVGATEEKIVATLKENFDKKVDDGIKNKAKKQGLKKKKTIIFNSLL